MEAVKMFVYGTLKSNHGNNYLMRNSTLIGSGVTQNQFALYQMGIPFVVKEQQVSQIHGELYEVPAVDVPSIDRLEGHPHSYRRQLTKVIVDGKVHDAFLYFYPEKYLPGNAEINKEGRF